MSCSPEAPLMLPHTPRTPHTVTYNRGRHRWRRGCWRRGWWGSRGWTGV